MGQYNRKLKKGFRWYYKGQYQGVPYNSKAIYLTKGECARAEREMLRRLDEQIRQPVCTMTLKELMSSRLDELETKKSAGHYKINRTYFKKALAAWGDVDVREITKAMVNDFMIQEAKLAKKEKVTNYRVNAMLRSLKALFNFGIKVHDLDIKNPCIIDFFPIDKRLKYIPPEEDINAVKTMCNQEQLLIFNFVDESACRIMEAVRFSYEDIDNDLVTLWTRKSRNSNLTPRRIPKPRCIDGMTGKGPVFAYQTAPKFLERYVRKLKQRSWNWHNLRHRRASLWASSGMSFFEISHRLGHSNLKTTQGYLQLLGFTRF